MTELNPHPTLPLPGGGIAEIIAKKGVVTVAEYMELALTHPEFGYYMQKDPLGAKGDFTTAPEISQIFGELVGLWLVEQWCAMGKPECALVELGPGRGTLMADMLRATKPIPGFHEAAGVHLIEASPTLKQKQWQALSGKHPRIEWHSRFSDIPQKPLLLVANEFFDALPVRQFVYDGEWKERGVGVENNQLAFVTPAPVRGSKAPSNVIDYLSRSPHKAGMTVEYSEAAESITNQLAAHIKKHGGGALIIDYGYEKGHGDTLQAVKSHEYHSVLENPGSADITCHVDFGLLKNTAEKSGAAVYGPVPQGIFLNALGAKIRAAKLCEAANDKQRVLILSGVKRLLSFDQMGDIFKAMAIVGQNHPKPEGF